MPKPRFNKTKGRNFMSSSNVFLPQEIYEQAVQLQQTIDIKFAEANQLRNEGSAAVQQLLDIVTPYQTRSWMGGPGMGLPGGPGGSGGSGLPWFPTPGSQGGGQQGGGPLGGGPQGGSPQAQAPTSPPPSHIPPKPFSAGAPGLYAVDPGAISRCLFRFTYVWLTNGDQFWFFPIFVGPASVAGFRWFPQFFSWRYFGIDVRRIDAFTC
jgi:hypothetical protein